MLESPRKRYLSGSDWVIAALDHQLRSTTCAGNTCQVGLLLGGQLDQERFRRELRRFSCRFPVLQGRVRRDLRLTPYWSIPPGLREDIPVLVSRIDDVSRSGELLALLSRAADSPFRDEREHLVFHIVDDGRRSALVMRFDHRLFDARGAESFLDSFRMSLSQEDLPSTPISFCSSSELSHWRRKFRAGKNVNRRIIALSRSTPLSLPLPPGTDRGFGYRLLCFDRHETDAIFHRADHMAGYLMESSFFLAAITASLHGLFVSRSAPGESYLVPVTTDLGSARGAERELFFNHSSYLFYQVPAQLAGDMVALVALFKEQMYDQIKSGFPRDLAEATLLSRIAPLPLMGRLMHLPLEGKLASYVFSHVGRSSFRGTEFMGCRVDNILHLPRVPAPPGLGVFGCLYDGRLTLTIAYLDGLLEQGELDLLESAIRRHMGAEAP
jgi:hypothetical protein